MLKNLFKIITPANLKKYGMYAILSFFITVSVLLAVDDVRIRDKDIKYEREQNETLRKMLDEQYKLKIEQERLIKVATHENH